MRFTEIAIISVLCCSVPTVSPVQIQCLHYENQAVSVVCSEHACEQNEGRLVFTHEG